MPTVEEILIDHQRQLDEHLVIVTGARADAGIARDKAFEAVADIAWTRIDVRSYTDDRIQYVLDYFGTTLTSWAEDIIATSGRYADGVGTNVTNTINNSLDDWRTNIQQEIDTVLADTAVLERWAEDTFNIEIPKMWEDINKTTEDVRQNEQEILNEANTARQENAEMAARWREMADQIEDHKNAIIEMDYSIYAVRDDIYRNISVEYDGRLASYDERITVAAGETGAVSDRVQTLEVSVADQYAQVQTLERAMIDGNTELAQQITSLSVGTNTQFDTFQIWHFDTASEGWTGTWVDGYIRVNDETRSPVLSVDAAKYRQVRARIKKVGNPIWNGLFTYEGATPGETITVPEPVWTSDLGEITINPTWSGTLTRMILNLSSGSTGTDHYLLDWITVGRPAPGASSADIMGERIARTTADSALGARIDSIDLRLTSGDGVIGVATDVVEGVKSEIIEDAIAGSIVAVNESITAFDTRIDNIETGQALNSSAISTLANRVTVQDQEIVAVNSRIDNFVIDDENLVDSQVFQALTQRVTINEQGIVSVNQSITQMNTSISTVEGNASAAQAAAQSAANLAGTKGKVFVQDSPPPTSERLAQNLWIDTTANANTPKRWNGSEWEGVTDKVARDAAAAAAQALQGLGDKADAAAMTALTQRVASTEQGLVSQAAINSSLNASITLVGNEAGTAQTAAQAAADLAGSKGKVLVQSAAPADADRLVQNLWIDITNNNNTPKRWNGTAWLPVTDKVALDAAAAAQNALNAVALKADATAVQELSTRVTENANGITSVGREITRLDNSVTIVGTTAQEAQTAAQTASNLAGSKGKVFFQNGAPPVAERLSQNLWIDTTGGNNTPKRWNGSAWASVTDKAATDAKAAADAANRAVGLKADATYVDSVDQKVNKVGTDLSTATSRITAVENRINNPNTGLNALSSSINATNTRVNTLGNTVTAQGNSTQALTATVNQATANTLFRASVTATPAGAKSRIAISARGAAGDNTQSAGIYIEAGTDNVNSVYVVASRFAIVQSANGEKFVPFMVKNGVVYIKTAYIENLTLGTDKFTENSISGTWTSNSNSVTFNLKKQSKVIILCSCDVRNPSGSGDQDVTSNTFLSLNGTTIKSYSLVNAFARTTHNFILVRTLNAGQNTLTLETTGGTMTGSPSVSGYNMAAVALYK